MNDNWLNRLEQKVDQVLQGIEADLTQNGQPEQGVLDNYRQRLASTLVKLNNLALRINEQAQGPAFHGFVLGFVPAPQLTTPAETTYEPGTKIKINSCSIKPALVGQTGYVLEVPDQSGNILLALTSGEVENFNLRQNGNELAVVPILSDRLLLLFDGRLIDVPQPENLELAVGDLVRVDPKNFAVLGTFNDPLLGDVALVNKVLDSQRCEVTINENQKIVFSGSLTEQLQSGHQVIVDKSHTVVLASLGEPDFDFDITEATGVSWDDIGGLEDAKEQLQDTLILPHQKPELFRFYGGQIPKGILLIGPPGGGKTMLAKAFATALAQHYTEEVPRGFINVKAPELLRSLVGETERLIRNLFAEGRRRYERLGYAVIFIDEIDAIGKKRGTGISTDIYDSIVPALLLEMSGLQDSQVMVILATNRVDILDPALTRSGRIDLKIVVPRPDVLAAEKIFAVHLRYKPLAGILTLLELAKAASQELHSEKHAFFRINLTTAEKEVNERLLFTLGHISSGAMIKAIVDAAVRLALKRDLKAGEQTGLSLKDIAMAIKQEFLQNAPLDHTDALREITEDLRDKVIGIEKLHQGRK